MYSTVGAREASGPSSSDDAFLFDAALTSPHHQLNLSPHNDDGFNPQCPPMEAHIDPPQPWQRPKLDKYQTVQIFKSQNQGLRFSSGGDLRQEYIGFGGWVVYVLALLL